MHSHSNFLQLLDFSGSSHLDEKIENKDIPVMGYECDGLSNLGLFELNIPLLTI